MRKYLLLLLFAVFHAAAYCSSSAPALRVADLTCEYQTNPTGLETQTPRFSWKIVSGKRKTMQKSFRILVASSKGLLNINKGDMWDKEVVSQQNTFLSYNGKPL